MIVEFKGPLLIRLHNNFSLFMKLSEFKRMVAAFFKLSSTMILLSQDGGSGGGGVCLGGRSILENDKEWFKKHSTEPVMNIGFHDRMCISVIDKQFHENNVIATDSNSKEQSSFNNNNN